jgi:hypothetical protein
MQKKIIIKDIVEIELRGEYLYIRYVDLCVLNKEGAEEVADKVVEICDGIRYPILTNLLGITINVSSDAKIVFATYPPLVKVRKAQAILVDNTPSRLLANFFLKFHRPSNPSKVFDNIEIALNWFKSLPD